MRKISYLLILILTILTSTTYAQFSGGSSGKRGNKGVTNSQSSNDLSDKTYNDISANIGKIESELALTPQQSPLWSNLLDKVQSYYDLKKKISFTSSSNSSAGIRYIQNSVNQSRNRYSIMEDIESAAKELYINLNDEQKKCFDQKIVLIIPFG